jgi:hypothetical protein
MIPVTQFILGNSDPLLYPSEKMTNSIDEQIAFLQSQKQAINEAYRRNIDNKVFESAITFWFKDVDFDGDKVWEYFHMNN